MTSKEYRGKVSNESEEQERIFQWKDYFIKKYPDLEYLYAIPNGEYRPPTTAARLKRQGVKAGVSDIHLPIKRGDYIGLWIELKVKPNRPTEKQRQWLDGMTAHGHYAVVAYGADEAIDVIERYLSHK